MIDDSQLVSSVAGVVDRVNKLICVRPLKTRYVPEIGDVIVGRVTQVNGSTCIKSIEFLLLSIM